MPVPDTSDKNLLCLKKCIQDSLRWIDETQTPDTTTLALIPLSDKTFGVIGAIVKALRDAPMEFSTRCQELLRQQDNINDLHIESLKSLKKVAIISGSEYELLVNGKELSNAGNQDTIFVSRFGAYDATVEPLRATHRSDLTRGKVYAFSEPKTTLFVIVDDSVRASFETVKKRSDWWTCRDEPDMEQDKIEGLQDRPAKLKSFLHGNPCFSEAVDTIKANHHTASLLQAARDIEHFLFRWLGLFKDHEAETILQVVAARRRITPADVNTFIDQVAKLRDRTVPFATKRTADMGGVQRLFTLTDRGQDIFRGLALERAVDRILEGSFSSDTLLVLTENIFSGSQLCDALDLHYFCKQFDENHEWISRNNLYEFSSGDPGVFQQQCRRFARVVVLSAAYTKGGAERVKESLCKALDIKGDDVVFRGVKLDDDECFFGKTPRIPQDSKCAFRKLVSNVDRIASLFKLDQEAKRWYKKSLREIGGTNLLVRPNSVPKKVFQLFTLQPRNSFLPPLFRRIPEHSS